jgi:hypothetical protein
MLQLKIFCENLIYYFLNTHANFCVLEKFYFFNDFIGHFLVHFSKKIYLKKLFFKNSKKHLNANLT